MPGFKQLREQTVFFHAAVGHCQSNKHTLNGSFTSDAVRYVAVPNGAARRNTPTHCALRCRMAPYGTTWYLTGPRGTAMQYNAYGVNEQQHISIPENCNTTP